MSFTYAPEIVGKGAGGRGRLQQRETVDRAVTVSSFLIISKIT